MPKTQPDFTTLTFERLDATQEAVEAPDLLTRGYYDYRNAAESIQRGVIASGRRTEAATLQAGLRLSTNS